MWTKSGTDVKRSTQYYQELVDSYRRRGHVVVHVHVHV